MITISNIALVIVIVANTAMGLLVFFRSKRSLIGISFVLFSFGLSLWAFTNAVFQITHSEIIAFWIAIMSYHGAAIATTNLYIFSLDFPRRDMLYHGKIKRLLTASIILGVFIIVFSSIPGLVLKDVIIEGERKLITSAGLNIYALFIITYLIWSLVNLIKKYRRAGSVERKQIFFIFVGLAIAILGGLIFNLFLPLSGNYRFVWLGPDFSIFMVIFITYAILKHGLFNLRLIATELFTALMASTLFIQMLISESIQEVLIRGVLLAIFLFLGVELIKSVNREIKAKEELVRVNQELKKTNKHLQELLQMKTEFLQIASHQLRTPLTAIRGLLSMQEEGIYDNIPEEERKKVRHDMLVSAERLNNIVNDLLRATELEGGIEGEFVYDDVALLVEQSIDTLKPNFEKKGLKLFYQRPLEALPMIRMRPEYLRQVFLNLIDNAERYTPQGEVRIKLYQNINTIVFEMKDTGIGITPGDRKKLFEKFGRGKEAIEIQPNGSGLGLFIVKRIVEEHKGKIEVKSEGRGKGSIFRVILSVIKKDGKE